MKNEAQTEKRRQRRKEEGRMSIQEREGKVRGRREPRGGGEGGASPPGN